MTSAPLSPGLRITVLGGVTATICTIYWLVGEAALSGPMHTLSTPIDEAVPLIPWLVVFYLGHFFQTAAPAFTLADRRALWRTVTAYLLLYAISTPIWLLWPVMVPRSPVPITDVWTYGLAIARHVDPPSNCMPSMHVALAMLSALIVRRHDRLVGLLMLLNAGLIILSTLTLKQHWLADVLVSVVLAWGCDRLCFDLRPAPPEAFIPLDRRWHLGWSGLWLAVTLTLMSGWWLGWMPLDRLPPQHDRWALPSASP